MHRKISIRKALAGLAPEVTAVVAGIAAAALVLAAPAGAAQHTISRPHPAAHSTAPLTSGTVTPVNDQFQGGNGGWCTYAQGCDGDSSGYGTIDHVPAGFSGGGLQDYAGTGNVSALDGSSYAVITGSNDVNQGQGCPDPSVTESCTGPYYLPGGGNDFTFPSHGFTVTDDLYLDTVTPGTGEIDVDTALNSSSGTPYGAGGGGIDNVTGFCSTGAGFSVTFSSSSPSGCSSSGTPQVTSSGWYRVVQEFTNVAGSVYLTQSVYAEAGSGTAGSSPVATSGPQPVLFGSDTSAEPVSAVGGPAYTWLPTLQAAGFVPMANYAIQVGQHQYGHTA